MHCRIISAVRWHHLAGSLRSCRSIASVQSPLHPVLRSTVRCSVVDRNLLRSDIANVRRMSSLRPQPVNAPLTKSATFLVLSLKDHKEETLAGIRSVLASTQDLSKNVRVRDPSAGFTCTVGIGSEVWEALTKTKKPKELHPFQEVKGAQHTAVSTPGDLLYHIRSDRRDICFAFEQQLMSNIAPFVNVNDCTVGFRYFDGRDLLGFVDGTANPEGEEATEAVLVADNEQDQSVQGGSYVVVQKYLHDLQTWNTLPTHAQEAILGRTKFDNIELDDAGEQEQKSHKTLCTVEQPEGQEHDIVRDNMPFGTPATNTFGTYFIGYSKELWVIEEMLRNMYIGVPAGKHDKTLDYSTPQTGSVFFAPSLDTLDALGDD